MSETVRDTRMTFIEPLIWEKLQKVASTQWTEPIKETILDSISITTPPHKSSYYIGDALDLTGMIITAYYSDGSSQEIQNYTLTYNGSPISDGDTTITATEGIKLIEISYSETFPESGTITKTAQFNIAVEVVPAVLVSISIEHMPNKIAYQHHETFDTTGLIVKAFYDDNSEKTLADTDYTIVPQNGSELDTAGTITATISYSDTGVTLTANFDIEVSAYLEAITLTSLPKTDYYQGDTFTTSGMVVTGIWSDGTEAPIIDGWTTSPYSEGDTLSTIEEQTIMVSYQTFTATYSIKIEKKLETIIKLTFNRDNNYLPTGGRFREASGWGGLLNYNWDVSVDGGSTWTNYQGTGQSGSNTGVQVTGRNVLIRCGTTEYDGWAKPLSWGINDISVNNTSSYLVKFEIVSQNPNVHPFCDVNHTHYYLQGMFYLCTNLEKADILPLIAGGTNQSYYLSNTFNSNQKLGNDQNFLPLIPEGYTNVDYYLYSTFRDCNLPLLFNLPKIPASQTSAQSYLNYTFWGWVNMEGNSLIEENNDNPIARSSSYTFSSSSNTYCTITCYRKNLNLNVTQNGNWRITINYVAV